MKKILLIAFVVLGAIGCRKVIKKENDYYTKYQKRTTFKF